MTLEALHQALVRGDAAARAHVERIASLASASDTDPTTKATAKRALEGLNLLERRRRATSYRAHGAPRIGGYGMPSSHRPGFGAMSVRDPLTPELAYRIHALCAAARTPGYDSSPQQGPPMNRFRRPFPLEELPPSISGLRLGGNPFAAAFHQDANTPPSIAGLRLGGNPFAAAFHQDPNTPPSIAGMVGAAHPSQAQLAYNASTPYPGGPTEAQINAHHGHGGWPHGAHGYWPGYGYVYPYQFASYWPQVFRCVQTPYGPVCFRIVQQQAPYYAGYRPVYGNIQYM